MIALALLELEDEDLLALELLDDLGGDLLVLERGRANDGLVAVVQEKDGELDLVARLRVELLDVDDVDASGASREDVELRRDTAGADRRGEAGKLFGTRLSD